MVKGPKHVDGCENPAPVDGWSHSIYSGFNHVSTILLVQFAGFRNHYQAVVDDPWSGWSFGDGIVLNSPNGNSFAELRNLYMDVKYMYMPIIYIVSTGIFHTWWLIPLSKWVITPIISGLTLLIPFITGIITHLLSGMSHLVDIRSPPLFLSSNPPPLYRRMPAARWSPLPPACVAGPEKVPEVQFRAEKHGGSWHETAGFYHMIHMAMG